MKSTLVSIFSAISVATAYSQGQLNFNTFVSGVYGAPIYGVNPSDPGRFLQGQGSANLSYPTGGVDYTGHPALMGTGFTAQLWGGLNAASLAPPNVSTGTRQFTTVGALEGHLSSGVTAQFQHPAGTILTLQVRAWDNRNNLITTWDQVLADDTIPRGWSTTFYSPPLALTSPPSTPGMTSFSLFIPSPRFSLTLATNGSGAVVRSPDQTSYASNTIVMLTNTPSPGWGFSGWSGNASGTANSLSVTMTNNKTITANFTNASGCVLPSGLVGWWPGAGNANDIIGTNNGTLQNGTMFAAGKVGQAFSFDGTNDFVEVPSSAGLSITGPITVEAWIQRSATTPQSIVEKYGTNQGGYGLRVMSNGRLQFFTIGDNETSDAVTGGSTLFVGTWYHVAGVWDGTALRVYVNGGLNVISSSTLSPGAGSSSLKIGARGHDAGTPFAGLIDEVAVFNRALTAAEIQAIYNAGSVGKCLTPVYITSVNKSGNNLNLSWQAQSGVTYQAQYKTNLNAATPWTPVSGDVTATTNTASKTDVVTANAPQRFYRVELFR